MPEQFPYMVTSVSSAPLPGRSRSGSHSAALHKMKGGTAWGKWLSRSNTRYFTIDFDAQLFFYSHSRDQRLVSHPIHFRDILGAERLPWRPQPARGVGKLFPSGKPHTCGGFILRTRQRAFELHTTDSVDVAWWVDALNAAAGGSQAEGAPRNAVPALGSPPPPGPAKAKEYVGRAEAAEGRRLSDLSEWSLPNTADSTRSTLPGLDSTGLPGSAAGEADETQGLSGTSALDCSLEVRSVWSPEPDPGEPHVPGSLQPAALLRTPPRSPSSLSPAPSSARLGGDGSAGSGSGGQSTPRLEDVLDQSGVEPAPASWRAADGDDDEGFAIGAPRTPPRRRSPRGSREVCRIHTPKSTRREQRFEAMGGHDPNEGRFNREFSEISVIGRGDFSTVYSAWNRTDGHAYAVKVQTGKHSPPSGAGDGAAQAASVLPCEAFTFASVAAEGGGCQHLLRYFSSWREDGRLHIQTELCGPSLRRRLVERRQEHPDDPRFGEGELVRVLLQVARGLASLHGLGFAHLDIKPDNILVGRDGRYKIADLGLAANVAAVGGGAAHGADLSEGDCRYLAKEVLGLGMAPPRPGDLAELPKADVFSLGIVCYELATNPEALPCGGDAWRRLREGCLDAARLPQLSEPLLRLLRRMVHWAPRERPPSADVAAWCPAAARDEVGAVALPAGKFAHMARVGHAGG